MTPGGGGTLRLPLCVAPSRQQCRLSHPSGSPAPLPSLPLPSPSPSISETYGEDVFLSSAVGVAATVALQQRTDPDPATGLYFLATSQVTRHYMGTRVCGGWAGGCNHQQHSRHASP